MEDLDDPRLKNKIANIKATLQRLGSSFTEDVKQTQDITDENKSRYSFDRSDEESYKLYTPKSNNRVRSED